MNAELFCVLCKSSLRRRPVCERRPTDQPTESHSLARRLFLSSSFGNSLVLFYSLLSFFLFLSPLIISSLFLSSSIHLLRQLSEIFGLLRRPTARVEGPSSSGSPASERRTAAGPFALSSLLHLLSAGFS